MMLKAVSFQLVPPLPTFFCRHSAAGWILYRLTSVAARPPLSNHLKALICKDLSYNLQITSIEIEIMPASYTALIQRDGPWWIGWVEEIPGVNSQGTTREELLDNLQSALQEALEMNRRGTLAVD